MTDAPREVVRDPTVTQVPFLPLHDLCMIMPEHTNTEYEELAADIRKNKLQVPIITYEGQILDGRGRYKACMALSKHGVETNYRTEPYTGPDPRRYVVSINVKRRHLNESQRALIAAQLATYTHGGDRTGKASIDALTQKEAAVMLNISEPSVERAAKILKNGVPALVEAVKAGKLRASAVEHFSKSDEQNKLIAECNGDVVASVKKLPKPPPVPKHKTENEIRNERKKAVDDLKHAWSQEFNDWQRRYFVKLFKDDIVAILKEIEEWQGEIDKPAPAPSTVPGATVAAGPVKPAPGADAMRRL